jgi:hypothetical protein
LKSNCTTGKTQERRLFHRSYHRHLLSLILANTSIVEQQRNFPWPSGGEIRTTSESSAPRSQVRKNGTYFKSLKKLPFFGLFQYQSTSTPAPWRKVISNSHDEHDGEDMIVEYKIMPAKWTRLRALSFQSIKSCGAWKYSFRQFRVVSHGPIFKACKEGSVEEIVKILTEGSASLYDVDDHGRNLLHVCPKDNLLNSSLRPFNLSLKFN